jgi:hypothetical protein
MKSLSRIGKKGMDGSDIRTALAIFAAIIVIIAIIVGIIMKFLPWVNQTFGW